jgi:hypothetical protein
MVTLHALSIDAMATYSDRLTTLFAEGNAFQELWRGDGMALMEMKDGKPVLTTVSPRLCSLTGDTGLIPVWRRI